MSNRLSKNDCAGQIVLLPTDCILPNPNQPRKTFDFDELKSLSESIKKNGILQPISVRPLENGKYELIAGERRLRGTRLAGLAKIPCIIIETDAEKSAMFSLMENIQRQNLNFFEEANGIYKLITNYALSQEETARQLGKSQSALSNKLRLLKLPRKAQIRIAESHLTERHARALLKLKNEKDTDRALDEIISKNLNVSQTECLINRMISYHEPDTAPRKQPLMLFKDIKIFVNTLNHAVETMNKSGIQAKANKKETDEFIEYTVQIPKKNTFVIRSQADA